MTGTGAGESKGYRSERLSSFRRTVIASASVTHEKNTIHTLAAVDITEARRLMAEHVEATGEKPSLTAYVVTCLAHVLRDHPRLNSFVKGRRQVFLDDVTVSVLVERELAGEKVPEPLAVRRAQSKSFPEIQREIRAAQREQDEELGSLSGHTYVRFIPGFLLKTFVRVMDRNIRIARAYGKVAVTAVGMYSGEPFWFVPHGSATVLVSVGSIGRRVVEVDGRLVSREHLHLTLSFDHDLVDGAPAARFTDQFLTTVKSGELLRAESEG